ATGSGPASITTASPDRTGRTTRSPCPTAHATTTAPDGGQPLATTRTGTAPITTATATTATARRTARRRAASRKPAVSPASSSAPRAPSGQGTTATGSRAPYRAVSTSHHAGQLPSQARNPAAGGHTGATAAARTPSTVAGATAGAQTRLATTATRLMVPVRPAITGETTSWAAAGTARASAIPDGTPRRRSASRHRGANNSSPPVARTERVNPASPARSGSRTTSRVTVAPRAGTAARGRPVASATRATAAITPARSTDGSARQRITYPASVTALSRAVSQGGARAARASSTTRPVTITRFAPLTATRWDMPVS